MGSMPKAKQVSQEAENMYLGSTQSFIQIFQQSPNTAELHWKWS